MMASHLTAVSENKEQEEQAKQAKAMKIAQEAGEAAPLSPAFRALLQKHLLESLYKQDYLLALTPGSAWVSSQ